MKLFTIFSATAICSPLLISAQSNAALTNSSTYIHCTRFYVSKPLRDFPDYKSTGMRKEAADRLGREARPKKSNAFHAPTDYNDPVRQTTPGSITASDATIVNFEGSSDSDWDPGDPNGAADSNYYVQLLNVTYTIYNKSGHLVMPVKDLGSLWSGDPQDGDPIALYDKFANRWFLSEFQVSNTPCQLCVAVSTTNDPTGSYYVWEFDMGTIGPDYPKYSIWTDGYYVTFQGFNSSFTNALVPQKVAVLERNRMLEGSPSAGIIIASLPTPPDFMGADNSLWSAPKTLDCDASALPPYGTPDYLVFFENKASGGYSNSIVMYKLTTDTTAHTLTVSRGDSLAVPYFNAYFSGGNCTDISQPGDPGNSSYQDSGVDALDGTFNFRVPYMVFTGYNSVLLSNTVNLGSSVAGIRWYELRQNDTTGVWSIYQDGTYGPNDGISRWNAAICMDYNGDIALEYSVAGNTVYPGIRYTGRLATDPLGEMTFAEQTAVNGTSTLSGTYGRWGDYSDLDIDPSDGVTFWGTNQYGGSSNNYTQLNRIFSFKLEGPTAVNQVHDNTALKVYQNGSFLDVIATGLPGNDPLVVNLFDITGRQLTSQNVLPVSNMFETKINVSALPAGVYFVRIGRVNFQKVVKTFIN